MAKIFSISSYNPFRFVQQVTRAAKYNTDPFSQRTDELCYKLKRQWTDTSVKIQFLSEYDDVLFNFYDAYGYFYKSIPINEVPLLLIDQPFKGYEAEVDFSEFDEGSYFCQLEYINEDSNAVVWQSAPIEVAETWPETLLFEYRNSVNKNNAIFDTGIEFNIRVEAQIVDFEPSFEYEGYVDQEYDATQLSSVTYDAFTLLVGDARGLPDYLLKILNDVVNVDTLRIDGTYYQKKVDGAKWELTRSENYPDAFAKIDILETENTLEYSLITGDITPATTIENIQRLNSFYAKSANFSIANTFRLYSFLDCILLFRNSGSDFTLNIGVTPSGSEIGSFLINDGENALTPRYLFKVAKTVYFSGFSGQSCDIFIDWKQLDSPPVDISGYTAPPKVGIGAKIIYSEVNPGDFELDWDEAAGVGKRDWLNWVIAGTNGTTDMNGILPIGYDRVSHPEQRDTLTGAVGNKITLTASQIPVLNTVAEFAATGGSGVTAYTKTNAGSKAPIQVNPGVQTQVDITPRSLRSVYVIKVSE